MNRKPSTPPSQVREDLSRKKQYSKPKLTVHGDLRTITARKHQHRNDGAGRPRTGSFTQA